MKYFGSSGIRGLVGKEITPELMYRVGAAVGTLSKRVVLGWDARTTNRMLANAVSAGVLSTGSDVVEIGLVATPTLAFYTSKYDAGIMITASHNPPEYNGVKLWNPDGTSFTTEQNLKVETLLDSGDFKKASWDKVGRLTQRTDAIEDHIEHIKAKIGPLNATVVVDCGNGGASTITPYLLREMGCRVISLNSQPDGTFSGRQSEPSEESLRALSVCVANSDANLGIAHDGDGDRMVAIDENGKFVGGDLLLPIFAGQFKGSKVVVPVNASRSVNDLLSDDHVLHSKVGDAFVSELMKETGALFGGEPSGTWTFSENSYCPDAMYAAAKLVALAQEKALSERTAELPVYITLRKRFDYDKTRRDTVMSAIFEGIKTIPGLQKLTAIDGVRADLESGWILVRPSGTEPKIKLVAESKSEEEARRLSNMTEEIIMGVIRQ